MALTASDVIASLPSGLLINGEWGPASGGGSFEVTNPATDEVLTTCADATVEDGMAAVAAASLAQAEWAAVPARQRAEILREGFEQVTARAEEFALLMTLEMGKPLAEALAEVTYGAEFFRWFSEEAVRVHGRYMPAPNGGARLLTTRQPVGPVLMITPWNFPLAMGTRKIGPAIAAGCTMVIKPAHETPLTTLALAQVLEGVGLPKGVLNVITTTSSSAVCEPIIRDGRIRKLTFTGSTRVGQILAQQSSQQLLRMSMELGGNAPFIVFDDADIDAAVDGAMLAKMRNVGEACTAANRFFVHHRVADEFTSKLGERMAALTVGDGTQPGVDVGPLITAKARSGIDELVRDAVDTGATVVTGGEIVEGKGNFYRPTVLADVSGTSRVMTEEIFGPVAPVSTFGDEFEVLERANATEFGLASYVYTKDYARIIRVMEGLEFGMVGVNTGIVSNPAAPFGGMKSSGYGREGGFEGIDEYLETKYANIAL